MREARHRAGLALFAEMALGLAVGSPVRQASRMAVPSVVACDGWHIQQILKIAGALNAPEQRVCILDSDNLFFREFDMGKYAGGEKTPLYFAPKAVSAGSPVHGVWMRTVDQLLGVKGRSFPTGDYVGNALVWDRDSVRAMTDAIQSATGVNWMVAMCRKKKFSEYLLYGHFVAGSPAHLAEHQLTEDSIVVSHWDDTSLDRSSIESMIRAASPDQAALCIQSYSLTPIEDIREVFRLSANSRLAPTIVPDHMCVEGWDASERHSRTA